MMEEACIREHGNPHAGIIEIMPSEAVDMGSDKGR